MSGSYLLRNGPELYPKHRRKGDVMLTTKRFLAVLIATIAGTASAQTAVTTPGGTTGTVPLFTATSTVGNSAITQTGSSIGIGTANPVSALDVNGSIVQRPGVANNAGNYLQTNANNTADQVNLNPGILFFGGAGSIGNEWGADLGFGNNRYRTRLFANSAIGDVALSYASFNPTSQASFTDGLVLRGDSGNVGIGTSSPGARLDVNGSIVQRPGVANNAGNYLQTNANNTSDQGNLNPGILFFNSGGNMWGSDLGFGNGRYRTRLFANNVGDVALSYASLNPTSQASFTDGLVLRGDSGNVGIGTSSPGARLEVNGGLKLSTGSPGITFGDGTTQMSAASSSPTSLGTVKTGVWNATPIAAAYLPSDVDYIDQAQTITGQKSFSGNVGIGTTTPNGPLDVTGINGGTGGFVVSGVNLDPKVGYPLSTLVNTGKLLQGWNRSAGAGEIDLISNRGGGSTGGFNFYDYTNSGSLNPLVTFQGGGNVGIGTSTPGSALEVLGNVTLTQGKGGSITYQDGSVQSVAWNGVLQGGDYAESVDVSGDRAEYEPGDVLVVDRKAEGRFLKSSQPYSTAVMGIYSTRPGVVGRRQKSDRSHMAEEVPMAMIGVVPTKVTDEGGPIEPGDLLVTSSKPGYAMKGTDHSQMMGAIIGKALGHLDSGTGLIEVAVSLQ
jgi:hypothetical protein